MAFPEPHFAPSGPPGRLNALTTRGQHGRAVQTQGGRPRGQAGEGAVAARNGEKREKWPTGTTLAVRPDHSPELLPDFAAAPLAFLLMKCLLRALRTRCSGVRSAPASDPQLGYRVCARWGVGGSVTKK